MIAPNEKFFLNQKICLLHMISYPFIAFLLFPGFNAQTHVVQAMNLSTIII